MPRVSSQTVGGIAVHFACNTARYQNDHDRCRDVVRVSRAGRRGHLPMPPPARRLRLRLTQPDGVTQFGGSLGSVVSPLRAREVPT
jgi:hypothetical protein